MMVRYEFYVEEAKRPAVPGKTSTHGWTQDLRSFSIRRRFPQRHEALLRAVEDESAASGKSSLFPAVPPWSKQDQTVEGGFRQ